jgi:hypothetical protein
MYQEILKVFMMCGVQYLGIINYAYIIVCYKQFWTNSIIVFMFVELEMVHI